MEKLNKEDYDRLKDRLYRALNAVEGALGTCPELAQFSVRLADGHELSPLEIHEWLTAARQACWQFGPADVRQRKLKEVMKNQPRG